MEASIIIPCYNCEKTIKTILTAISKQTLKPKEIIVIDDGSTDRTKEIIFEVLKKEKLNIRYFWQKNSGPAKARNEGAKRATAEIITFADSDCIPEINWLFEMIKPFEKKDVSGIQGAYKSRQKELIARFGQIEIEERYEKMKHSKNIDWIGSYSAAFRRKEFLSLGGYDESFPIASGEDPEFSFRLAKRGGKLIFNPNAIVYHTHPSKLVKYLKTKFFRAYYRPKMYSKHKEKILTDSYTPQLLKIQIPLSGIIIAALITAPIVGFTTLIATTIIFGITTLPFVYFASKKDFTVAIASPILVLFRSLVFGAGLISGILTRGKK